MHVPSLHDATPGGGESLGETTFQLRLFVCWLSERVLNFTYIIYILHIGYIWLHRIFVFYQVAESSPRRVEASQARQLQSAGEREAQIPGRKGEIVRPKTMASQGLWVQLATLLLRNQETHDEQPVHLFLQA